MNGCGAMTSRWMYDGDLNRRMDVYFKVDKDDLVGHLVTKEEKQTNLPNSIHTRRLMAAVHRFLE